MSETKTTKELPVLGEIRRMMLQQEPHYQTPVIDVLTQRFLINVVMLISV